MRYHLNITLTEEDYLAFNNFHSLESAAGKKVIRNSRIVFAAVMAALMALFILMVGWTTFSVTYAVLLGLFTVVYTLLFKRILKRNIRAQINRLKKTGKLPFEAAAELEFHEEKIVEITANKRVEQSYDALERICIAGSQYIYLYHSSVNAYIIPVPQLEAQLDRDAFIDFLAQKCSGIERY